MPPELKRERGGEKKKRGGRKERKKKNSSKKVEVCRSWLQDSMQDAACLLSTQPGSGEHPVLPAQRHPGASISQPLLLPMGLSRPEEAARFPAVRSLLAISEPSILLPAGI